MALTKYVSAFPFLNMMYLEFPFSFQRCHPFMWALSLQPNMTQIYNIIGHITVLTIWLINLMPFNPPKKVRFLCEVFLNVGRHHAFHIMNTFKSYPTTFLYSFGWSILQARHHPYKTSLHLYFLKIIIDCLAMENGDIQSVNQQFYENTIRHMISTVLGYYLMISIVLGYYLNI